MTPPIQLGFLKARDNISIQKLKFVECIVKQSKMWFSVVMDVEKYYNI